MAKAIKVIVKVQAPAGKATPAPPLGPVLGQHGINIGEFVKKFNEATASMAGDIVPAEITIYEDRTFTFVTKLPPVSAMIKKTLSLPKGSPKPLREPIGTLTAAQVKDIASAKLADLNTDSIESAIKTVTGTARSMGVKVI